MPTEWKKAERNQGERVSAIKERLGDPRVESIGARGGFETTFVNIWQIQRYGYVATL